MSTATTPTPATTPNPASTPGPAPGRAFVVADDRPTRSAFARTAAYAAVTTRHTLSDVSFLVFTVALPVVMFLVFAGLNRDVMTSSGVSVAGLIMISMAAYGGLGAAMSAGFSIQGERRDGWFRQLSLTGVSPFGLVLVRLLNSSVVVLPAIAVLFAVARVVHGIALPWQAFLTSGLMLWLALLPMVLLGLAIALWLPPTGGQALVTITLLALAIVGGLWFPVDLFPDWLQLVSRWTPSWAVGQLGTWGIVGGAFPTRPLWVLLGWSAALAVLCVVGYRRGVRSSRR